MAHDGTMRDTREKSKQGMFQLDVRRKTEGGKIYGGSLEDHFGMSD